MDVLNQLYFLFSDFLEPNKRVFLGYLFLSLLIAFVWLFFIKSFSLRHSLKKLFDRRVFFSESARTDYKIFVLNRIAFVFISPLLLTKIAIATAIFYALHDQPFISAGQFSEVSKVYIIALFTLTMFVVDDFTKYLLHRWMHRWSVLWAIHKIHHSAETLTPVTVYRVHPLEGVLYALRSTVAQGLTISVFIFLFGSAVSLYTVVGVNILVFFFHVTGSNLRHSHISIRYWSWLEYILISPAQHQIHHSVAEEHYDKNFGAALAIWDWLFGSLHLSEKNQDIKFGLDKSESTDVNNLRTVYITPFLDIFFLVSSYFKSGIKRLSSVLDQGWWRRLY